jgi:preprotein translocase subunit YajC
MIEKELATEIAELSKTTLFWLLVILSSVFVFILMHPNKKK